MHWNLKAARACLDQLLIAIRSLIIPCDHIRSKRRLIMVVNLIAISGIIYTSLHNQWTEYHLSLLLHKACYYRTWGEREGGE